MKLLCVLLCLCYLACPPLLAQNNKNAKQFIPNPAFQFTTNEKVMEALLRESGYASIHLIPADKLKKITAKLFSDTAMYTKIDGWNLWKDLNKKNILNRTTEKIKDDTMRIYLCVSEPDFLGTYLTEPMQAGKQYKIMLKFLHQTNIDNLEKNQMPEIGFAFLPESPMKMQKVIKPQMKYNFIWNPDAKYFVRRRKIIEKYQKENGGNFENKDWKNFQGIQNGKEKYDTISVIYTAKGGEMYVAFGNFLSKKNTQKPYIKLTLSRFYIHELNKYTTIKEN